MLNDTIEYGVSWQTEMAYGSAVYLGVPDSHAER